MNRQEVFTKVKDHLLKQNKAAVNAGYGACAYLAPDGLKCAVGCLIPDGHTAQSFRSVVLLFWRISWRHSD